MDASAETPDGSTRGRSFLPGPAGSRGAEILTPRTGLGLILLAAGLLHLWIVVRGGQQFWPDESRYHEARVAVARMARGEWRPAWEGLLGASEHIFFKIAALIPATGEQVWGGNPILPAAFFAVFPVLSIWMIWRIVRRSGGDDTEALIASFMAAGTNCLFYFSRHFFPYDLALFFFLWAVDLGFRPGAGHGLPAGLLSGLGVLSYNGYWFLCAVAGLAGLFCARPTWRKHLLWALGFGGGVLVPIVVVGGAAGLVGRNLPAWLVAFSGTITQGDIGEGWRFIPEYLWSAEHANVLIWVAAAAMAVAFRKRLVLPRRCVWWATCAGLVYCLLVVSSDLLGRFVVYGRTARAIAPFLILTSSAVLGAGWRRGGFWRNGVAFILLGFGLQAAWNLREPLTQVFPERFEAMAREKIRALDAVHPANYRVVDASFFYTPASVIPEVPGETIFSRRHPFCFTPYLFEGFTRLERTAFERLRPKMLVVRLQSVENRGWLGNRPELARRHGYPGAVRMRVHFVPDADGGYEPLVVTGESGEGDFLYVIYQDAIHLRIGFDHWGVGGRVSDNLQVDWAVAHSLVVSMGSLYPPEAPAALRKRLFVELDGLVVFDEPADFFPADPGSVVFGLNLIGGSTTRAVFRGQIEEVRAARLPGAEADKAGPPRPQS